MVDPAADTRAVYQQNYAQPKNLYNCQIKVAILFPGFSYFQKGGVFQDYLFYDLYATMNKLQHEIPIKLWSEMEITA